MSKTEVYSLIIYAMIGAGVFISLNSRTAQRCPDEDMSRAVIYSTAWPMLVGFRILDGDMKKIPNCKVEFPNEQNNQSPPTQ